MTTPASAKQLAAKLRAIEKANPGMKYRALFLSTIGDVAALESDGQALKKCPNCELEDMFETCLDGAVEQSLKRTLVIDFCPNCGYWRPFS
jgi:hypothetical protein